MEAIRCFEVPSDFPQTAWPHIAEASNLRYQFMRTVADITSRMLSSLNSTLYWNPRNSFLDCKQTMWPWGPPYYLANRLVLKLRSWPRVSAPYVPVSGDDRVFHTMWVRATSAHVHTLARAIPDGTLVPLRRHVAVSRHKNIFLQYYTHRTCAYGRHHETATGFHCEITGRFSLDTATRLHGNA